MVVVRDLIALHVRVPSEVVVYALNAALLLPHLVADVVLKDWLQVPEALLNHLLVTCEQYLQVLVQLTYVWVSNALGELLVEVALDIFSHETVVQFDGRRV